MPYKVAVLMGSPNDRDKMQPAVDTLERFGIDADVRVLSAHRNPAKVTELAGSAREQGYSAFICGAVMAAHLAGVVAAHTTLPVVGVPLSGGAINGVDALYSTVQMPKGIPVATVAIGNATNAGLLAAAILAVSDDDLGQRLAAWRERQTASVLEDPSNAPPLAPEVSSRSR
jgi:5-(carboxyamino)imidazole ribonucleotide mutase